MCFYYIFKTNSSTEIQLTTRPSLILSIPAAEFGQMRIMYYVLDRAMLSEVSEEGPSSCPIWILCRGGCSGRGVQWMGVILYSKTAYNRM